MDISATLAPKSDQLDAVDLLGGPRTFTVADVSKGASDEQPVNVRLAEFPRPWRPGKSMRRVLANVWGVDASQWVGKRLTLFCDPRVKFGGEEVGGIRISHLSHLEKQRTIPLLVTKGRSAGFVVKPLVEEAPAPARATSPATDARARLRAWCEQNGVDLATVAKRFYDEHGHELKDTTDVVAIDDLHGALVAEMRTLAEPTDDEA